MLSIEVEKTYLDTRNGRPRYKYNWTPEILQYTYTEMWENGRSATAIAKELGVPSSTFLVALEKNNIPCRDGTYRRTYKINDQYFAQIDNPEKAYWLGYLYADGYVHTDKTPYNCVFEQAESERSMVEQFVQDIQWTGEIKTVHHKVGQPLYRADIHSKRMIQDLKAAGCVYLKPNRRFPSKDVLQKDLHWHFFRGLFDGDGSLSKWEQHNNLTFVFSLHGSYDLLDHCNKYFANGSGTIRKVAHVSNDVDSFEIRISTQRAISNIFENLYIDATRFVQRKYERFLEFQQYVNSRAS